MPSLLLLLCLTADARLDRCLLDDEPDDAAFSTVLREITPGGTLTLGDGILRLTKPVMEFRNKIGEPNRSLGITIRGSGNTMILGDGPPHDIFNLNNVGNVRIENVTFAYVDTYIDKLPGVNAISLTNGTPGIVIDNVIIKSMPFFYVKNEAGGVRFDGGKGISLQHAAGDKPSTLVVRNCTVIDTPVAYDVSADPNKVAPGSIVIDRCEAHGCTVGVGVSFTYAKDTPKGFRVDVLNSRFSDTLRPLVVSRACDVRFIGNETSFVNPPALPDPFAANFGDAAITVKGGTRVTITGNTLFDRRDNTMVLMLSASGPHQPCSMVTTEPNTISR